MRIVSNMVVSFCYARTLSIAMPVATKTQKPLSSKGLRGIAEKEGIKKPFHFERVG